MLPSLKSVTDGWRLRCGRASRWLQFGHLARDRRGAVAVITALSLTLLCGIIGLSTDLGMWYWQKRKMQNAADAAAIAAAVDGSSSYQSTGLGVAANYGFVNGTGTISVTIANNQPCPNGDTNCYTAQISETAPQFFTAVLGIKAPNLASTAIASPTAGKMVHQYCLVALASSGHSPGILMNGIPKADMTGCSAMSNTDMTCHGHNLNATYGDAAGTDDGNPGCGNTQNSHVPAVSDPYSSLSSNIPADTCGGNYPQEGGKGSSLPATNQWSGSITLPATQIVCGDLQLTADTTLTTASPGSVVVIENGQLDTNGFTLKTAPGLALTIIFTGSNGSYTHAPTGGGTLDFQAPTSGPWSGIAIYQDPALKSGVDVSAAGNSPSWDITGVVYLPHSNVTLSGAVGKSDNGAACFVLVTDHVTFNGTGAIESHGGCAAAGVAMPQDSVPGPGLVM
jgi:Flp pilus assembly protein TadG